MIFFHTKESEEFEQYWKDRTEMKAEKSDFNIKVFPDCAWATYIETDTCLLQGEPFKSEAIHLTVLEKIEGQ